MNFHSEKCVSECLHHNLKAPFQVIVRSLEWSNTLCSPRRCRSWTGTQRPSSPSLRRCHGFEPMLRKYKCSSKVISETGHRLMPWKVPNVKFNYIFRFSTLIQNLTSKKDNLDSFVTYPNLAYSTLGCWTLSHTSDTNLTFGTFSCQCPQGRIFRYLQLQRVGAYPTSTLIVLVAFISTAIAKKSLKIGILNFVQQSSAQWSITYIILF